MTTAHGTLTQTARSFTVLVEFDSSDAAAKMPYTAYLDENEDECNYGKTAGEAVANLLALLKDSGWKFHFAPKAVGEAKYAPTILTKRDGTPIPSDEPWMAFRGQDKFTLPVLHFYREVCLEAGCPPKHLAEIDERILSIGAFQSANPGRVKRPD